jgi:hypothetical protein
MARPWGSTVEPQQLARRPFETPMTASSPTSLPPANRAKQIESRLVADLLLDPENPRLAEEGRALTDDQLLAKLYAGEALDELATSFARSGYFWEEPLVVVPHGAEHGKYVVVEGNRRLATLKLLLSPAKRAELNATDFPDLTPERSAELQEVPTVAYANRAEVVPYLGFRHITGAKKWEPHAKARYIAQLVKTGTPLDEIENAIGDGATTVKKLYQAFVVFEQIRDELEEDVQNVKESFSLLEVLLGQQPVKTHLGLPRRLPDAAIQRIVDDAHLEALREVIHWVFGSRKGSIKAVIADSREIPKLLAPVIGNPQSLAYLRDTRDLHAAFERTGGEREYLLKQLGNAKRAAERALAVSPQFKGDSGLIGEVDRLVKTVEALHGILRP